MLNKNEVNVSFSPKYPELDFYNLKKKKDLKPKKPFYSLVIELKPIRLWTQNLWAT